MSGLSLTGMHLHTWNNGVSLYRTTNAQVRGCTFTVNQVGTMLMATANSVLGGSRFEQMEQEAVYATTTCTYLTISNNDIRSGFYEAIFLNEVQHSTVSNNTIDQVGSGIYVRSPSAADTITGNRLSNCAYDAITLENAANCFVQNNVIDSSAAGGIVVSFASAVNNLVDSNTISRTAQRGIYLIRAAGVTLTNNLIMQAGDYGIYADRMNGTTLTGNRISGGTHVTNGGIGITAGAAITADSNAVTGCSGSALVCVNSTGQHYFRSNRLSANGGCGVLLDSTAFATLTGNEITDNDSWAVALYGTSFADTLVKNTVRPAAGRAAGNSATAGWTFDLTRNAWGSTDSGIIAAAMGGTNAALLQWQPYRLGTIDTRPGQDTIAPAAPVSVTAVAVGLTGCSITWGPAGTEEEGGGNTADTAGFRIWRATAVFGPYVLAGTAMSTATGFADSGLTIDSTYYYRVTAYDNHVPWPNESWFSTAVASATPSDSHSGPIWYVSSDTGSDAGSGSPAS
ncbi:MAG TPA: right-handed parallel beta-helix repeat-containing protein, partial [bacterium]|nr:right-handed parallel beta-helix repeat-containing protein [bacterium]